MPLILLTLHNYEGAAHRTYKLGEEGMRNFYYITMPYVLPNSQSSLLLADNNCVRHPSSLLRSSYIIADDLGVSMRLKYGFLLKVRRSLSCFWRACDRTCVELYRDEYDPCVPDRVTVGGLFDCWYF